MRRADFGKLLGGRRHGHPRGPVVVAEREPARFLRRFADGVASAGPVFLADPAWGEVERRQLQALAAQMPADPGEDGWLGIPSGGSTGALKLARHDEVTVAAAVRGFTAHFSAPVVSAVGVLPLHHVSGLMAWMRTALTGGEFVPWTWKELEQGQRPPLARGEWFLSLVPTQLERLLREPTAVDWLRRFRAVFIGGGPSWPELVERAAEARLPLAFSYGMTETAAMVTALRPEEFLAGARGQGGPLPHARVAVTAEGTIELAAESLFRGYWPDRRPAGPWQTGDLGKLDQAGRLHVLGRRDALIITGGEKVDPTEVEAALRATGAFSDVAVIGLEDPRWGQLVVACYPGGAPMIEPATIERLLRDRLARFKWPKRYVAVAPWPRNAQGKISHAALRAALAAR